LLEQTGWKVAQRMEVTEEFARCMDTLLCELRTRRVDFVELLGEADHAERLVHRRSTRAAIARGLLRRDIFLAT
jgi:hypothetical protein